MAAASYLLITIIRGKGSVPYWVQIPTVLSYGTFVVLVKLYGDNKKYQPIFNKYIPLFELGMYLPNIMFTNVSAYDNEVIWAFCLSTNYTLFQIFSLLFALPLKT